MKLSREVRKRLAGLLLALAKKLEPPPADAMMSRVCECGHYTYCEQCQHRFCDTCYPHPSDDDDNSSCPVCSLAIVTPYDLSHYLAKRLGWSMKKAEAEYRKAVRNEDT